MIVWETIKPYRHYVGRVLGHTLYTINYWSLYFADQPPIYYLSTPPPEERAGVVCRMKRFAEQHFAENVLPPLNAALQDMMVNHDKTAEPLPEGATIKFATKRRN